MLVLTLVHVWRRNQCRRDRARRPSACPSYSPVPGQTSARIRKERASVRFECGTPLARVECIPDQCVSHGEHTSRHRPPNALPLSCGRAPQATDRQLQRPVRRLINREPARREPAIVDRVFRASCAAVHSMFLADEKPTPRSGHPEFVFVCRALSPRSEPGHPRQVRRTPCRSAASPPHERFVDVTPISLRRDRPLQRLVGRSFAR